MKIKKLAILWTSDNKETVMQMILRYTLKSNLNNWWEECHLITWGPSNKLLCEDKEVQEQLKLIMATGVNVRACLNCAKAYDLVDKLEALGIEVVLMGEPFTDILQDEEYRIITI